MNYRSLQSNYARLSLIKLDDICLLQYLTQVWHHCDLQLWPFDPKTWHVQPCPKMHQRWNCGEIQSSNFQDIVSRKPKEHCPACWTYH